MNERPLKCYIHLCKAHAMHMLMTQGKKDVYLLGKSGMDVLYPLLLKFLTSSSMDEIIFHVRRVFVLCLSEYENPMVLDVLGNLHKPMPANFEAG